jgi:hypothetical protein
MSKEITRRQALGYLGASALATFIGAIACVSGKAIEQKHTPEPTRTPTDKPVDPTTIITATPLPTQKPPPPEAPTIIPSPAETPGIITLESGDILIGNDYIAMDDKKILEFLNRPGNEGRFTIPTFVNPDTYLTAGAQSGGKNYLMVNSKPGGTLFNPSLSGIDHVEMIGESNKDTTNLRIYFMGGKFYLSILGPKGISVPEKSLDELRAMKFGEVIASNLRQFSHIAKFKEVVVGISPNEEDYPEMKGIKPLDYILRDSVTVRFIVRKPPVVLNTTPTNSK